MNKISIIIPVFNEEKGISLFYSELKKSLENLDYNFEIIFINDGSRDKSLEVIKEIAKKDKDVKYLSFSRNFGKEIALTAGINSCTGDACLTLDADLQHPPRLIPEFLKKWEEGNKVVIGVRENASSEKFVKKIGSKIFYNLINRISETKLIPNSTDFRLIDRVIIDEFNKLKEKNRITRGLIDWLGFKRDYVYFKCRERDNGKPTYSFLQLARLAVNSMVSLSIFPLRLAGYLGIFITSLSAVFGTYVLFSKYIFKTAWGLSVTGTGFLALILMFLVGITLICLGLTALYISHIYEEVINRPLYIIEEQND